jgi:hypothetical protein
MRKLAIILLTLLVCVSLSAEEKDPATTFSVSVGQDPAFGFYPSFFGTIELKKNLQFTTYGIFWTADNLGGYNGGLNLLTEFGVGLNFTLLDSALNINPQLGFAHGNYQSGAGSPVIADNIVPSIGVYYSADYFNLSLNVIYWKGLRKEAGNSPFINMLEYTIQPSYAVSKFFTVGLYYDHLFTEYNCDRYKNNPKYKYAPIQPYKYTTYLWIGPSIKFTFNKGINVMFTAGMDLVDYMNDSDIYGQPVDKRIKEYYKLIMNIPFQ